MYTRARQGLAMTMANGSVWGPRLVVYRLIDLHRNSALGPQWCVATCLTSIVSHV